MSPEDQIPLFRPLIGDEEIQAAQEALEMGWLGMGSYVGQFEAAIEQGLGEHTRQVVAVSTGTAALHLCLLLAGVGEGDEVITPAFNNVADFQAILACGGRPVFCDIDQTTLCLDVERAAELVSSRTKALIAMDYSCLLAEHAEVARLANEHRFRVVHDASHSFGSVGPAGPVGAFSDLCTFSFDPIKSVTCIDGGAVVVQESTEADRLREMRLIGMTQPASVMYQNQRAQTYDVTNLGYRYHMSNLHAALGLAQIAKLETITNTRRATCQAYNNAFTGLEGLTFPQTDFEDVTPFSYYVRVHSDRRSDFRKWLAGRGVDTGFHWPPRSQVHPVCRMSAWRPVGNQPGRR